MVPTSLLRGVIWVAIHPTSHHCSPSLLLLETAWLKGWRRWCLFFFLQQVGVVSYGLGGGEGGGLTLSGQLCEWASFHGGEGGSCGDCRTVSDGYEVSFSESGTIAYIYMTTYPSHGEGGTWDGEKMFQLDKEYSFYSTPCVFCYFFLN